MEIARQRQLSKTTIVEQENIFTQIYIRANFHHPKIFPGIYMYTCDDFLYTKMYICTNFHRTKIFLGIYRCIYAAISIPIHAKLVKNQSIGIGMQNLSDGDVEVTLLFGSY